MLPLQYHLALAALRSGTNGLCEAGMLLRAAYHGRFMGDGSDPIRLCSTPAQAALKRLFRENSNTLGTFARICALSALGATLPVLAYAGLQLPMSALLIPGFPRGPF